MVVVEASIQLLLALSELRKQQPPMMIVTRTGKVVDKGGIQAFVGGACNNTAAAAMDGWVCRLAAGIAMNFV